MATLTKEDFDVYVDNKLNNAISVYKLNEDEYIVLLNNYKVIDYKKKEMSRGVYYLDTKEKEIYLLTNVKKLELKDNGKTLKIDKSSIEDRYLLQLVDHDKKNLKITNDEIKFTPNLDLITEGRNPDWIDKKEVILRKRKTSQ